MDCIRLESGGLIRPFDRSFKNFYPTNDAKIPVRISIWHFPGSLARNSNKCFPGCFAEFVRPWRNFSALHSDRRPAPIVGSYPHVAGATAATTDNVLIGSSTCFVLHI